MRQQRNGALIGLALLATLAAWACAPSDGNPAARRPTTTSIDLNVTPVAVGPLASCWIDKDTSVADPFFLADTVQCQVTPPPAPLQVAMAFAEVRSDDGSVNISKSITAADQGKPIVIGHVYRTKWPATINVSVELVTAKAADGQLPGAEMSVWLAAEQKFVVDAASKTVPMVLASPVALWKVAFVPAKALRSGLQWVNLSTSYSVPAPTTRLCVSGPKVDGTAKVALNRALNDAKQLLEPIWLPVAAASATSIDMRFMLQPADGDGTDKTSSITAPGYFTLEADGTIHPTVAADLEGLDPVPSSDSGPAGSDPHPGTTDAGPSSDSLPAATCNGVVCGDGLVCVANKCVDRSQQTQSNDAVCDGDDNGDCADGHACVAGMCKNRSWQTQNNGAACDGDENTDCADGHVCVAGMCKNRGWQTQNNGAACDGDDSTDCADGHVCVAGMCKNRSWQTQNNGATCDGDDNGDCADGHVCVAGMCKNRSWQTQSNGAACDAGEDSDCADGYTCQNAMCKLP